MFEEKRNLIRDLFKTYRESSATPNVVTPPSYEALRSNVESIIARAELLPEQNLGAIEITAAGGHNLFMFGPPGGGKSLLAKALPSILPKLSASEALEVTKIYSIALR